MVVSLYRACTVFVKYLHTCVICLSFGLVLHALQVLVPYLGPQILFPNHCMNGCTLDLDFPLFCFRLESAEIPT